MLVTEQNQVNIIQRKPVRFNNKVCLLKKILRRLKISDVTSVEPMKSVAIDYIKGADKNKYVFSATSALDEMTIDLAAGRKVSRKRARTSKLICHQNM